MSLLVIHLIFLEVQDGELVAKELAAVHSHSNRVSSYVFKRPYGWEEVRSFNARMNQSIDHGCKWNDGDVLYSDMESWRLCYIAKHHLSLQSIASGHRNPNLLVFSSTVQLLISLS